MLLRGKAKIFGNPRPYDLDYFKAGTLAIPKGAGKRGGTGVTMPALLHVIPTTDGGFNVLGNGLRTVRRTAEGAGEAR